MHVQDISRTGRNTQGVRLIRIGEGEGVATVAKVDIDEEAIEAELEEQGEVPSNNSVEDQDTIIEDEEEQE